MEADGRVAVCVKDVLIATGAGKKRSRCKVDDLRRNYDRKGRIGDGALFKTQYEPGKGKAVLFACAGTAAAMLETYRKSFNAQTLQTMPEYDVVIKDLKDIARQVRVVCCDRN